MATIGDSLTSPETGWQRIEETDSHIETVGSWSVDTSTSYSGGRCYYSTSPGRKIKICAKTKNIRILGACHSSYSTTGQIIVDGTTYNAYYNTSGNANGNILIFELLNLTDTKHIIEVVSNDSAIFVFDAIDIDETGKIYTVPKSVGDKIPEPEDGYIRIQETDSKIKFISWVDHSHEVYSGGTTKYTTTNGAVAKLKFYGENFKLIGAISSGCSSNFSVKIDDILYDNLTSYASSTQYQTLIFDAKGLEKKEHKVIITNNSTGQLYFDAIDIDNYGYLIDFADIGDTISNPKDGYTRYDINSENLVEGIELSSTNWQTETNNNYYDNTNCYSNVNGAKTTIYFHGTDLMLIGAYNSSLNSDNISISLDEGTSTTVSESKDISYKTLIYQLHDLEDIDHVLTITNNSNSILSLDAVDINKDGYLYKPTTSNYILIKQNDKYYSFNPSDYDTTTKMYKTVSLTDDTSNFSNDISILFTSVTLSGETFKPIDKFKNDTFKIISNYNIGSKYKIYGRKVKSSMIVSNSNFSTANVDNIKYFSLDGKATIKIVVNPSDSGWYTYNGGNWIELGLTIPSKNYTDLTSEELTQWNNAKNTILSQGIAYSDLKNCNFSTLSNDGKTLKFAYVIYNENYGSGGNIKSLSWCYSKNGKLKMCKDSEYDIEVTNDGALITSLIDTDIMKIVAFYENKVGE